MGHFLLAVPSVVNWCGNDQRDSSWSLALPTFLPVLLTEQAEQKAYFSLTVYRMDWCLLFRYKHVHGRTCKASLLGNKYLFNIFWQQISERFTFPLSTVQASLTWLDAQVNVCTGAALSCREAWTWRVEKWRAAGYRSQHIYDHV